MARVVITSYSIHYTKLYDANPDYTSLNLGAAVQLLCYELRLAAHAGRPAEVSRTVPFASRITSYNVCYTKLLRAGEARVGVGIGARGFADDGRVRWQQEGRSKLRARRLCDAVTWPGTALLLEGAMVGGVPVPGGNDWQAGSGEAGNLCVEFCDNGVAIRHAQCAAGEKVVLIV